uniref:Uncharacterized protein n=1 Tax=Chromera velia CCMP2878 TaxID=1169474 RepID=A0A0G4H8K3_9ALVE|eukprot:Cvel_5884.t1-p1 / transcript=Cvel_5884.t1 / gene=Cvel_5884 / organism=Chromera_velia_CCMP2878 / gene_product=hypothetical protein / transcript_product=hypothetical protein / location=Cvel_scaffold280:50605-51673(+) / protein_length=144 / sequence_SO=supercontig / SO=protein_coding / is_pseudo=false
MHTGRDGETRPIPLPLRVGNDFRGWSFPDAVETHKWQGVAGNDWVETEREALREREEAMRRVEEKEERGGGDTSKENPEMWSQEEVQSCGGEEEEEDERQMKEISFPSLWEQALNDGEVMAEDDPFLWMGDLSALSLHPPTHVP